MPNPLFDIDDLSFFRCYGLGLRHVELARGLSEAANGARRGDAVSLANYGDEVKRYDTPTHDHSNETCIIFQNKLKDFIRYSYRDYHVPPYSDAVFLLINRGWDAKLPYDFHNYPLGKCGTQAFSSHQVWFLISSDRYPTNDLNVVVNRTLSELKEGIKKLKLQKIEMLLTQLRDPALFYEPTHHASFDPEIDRVYRTHLTTDNKAETEAMLLKIIDYYQRDIVIPINLFHTMEDLLNSRHYSDMLHKPLAWVENRLSKLRELFCEINQTIKKSEEIREQEHLQQTRFQEKLTHLKSQIENLHSYGCQLEQTDDANSQVIIQLSHSLRDDVDNFFQNDRLFIMAEYQRFQQNFTNQLHEADGIINTTVKQIIANIIIALTGIGIVLLIAQLTYSGCTTGNHTFFFDDTVKRQQHIDSIESSLHQMILSGF